MVSAFHDADSAGLGCRAGLPYLRQGEEGLGDHLCHQSPYGMVQQLHPPCGSSSASTNIMTRHKGSIPSAMHGTRGTHVRVYHKCVLPSSGTQRCCQRRFFNKLQGLGGETVAWHRLATGIVAAVCHANAQEGVEHDSRGRSLHNAHFVSSQAI